MQSHLSYTILVNCINLSQLSDFKWSAIRIRGFNFNFYPIGACLDYRLIAESKWVASE